MWGGHANEQFLFLPYPVSPVQKLKGSTCGLKDKKQLIFMYFIYCQVLKYTGVVREARGKDSRSTKPR